MDGGVAAGVGGVVDRWPRVSGRVGLGVGLDLPWGGKRGLVDDGPAPAVRRFLERGAGDYASLFVSFQPRDRRVLDAHAAKRAAAPLSAVRAALPSAQHFALHHTMLNAGLPQHIDRGALFDFTNGLVDACGFAWINEDLAIWQLDGHSLPYPLPPVHDDDGVACCVNNVREIQRALAVPFVVEMPGFTEGASFVVGDMDPFDFFRRVVEDTGAPCNLDVAHVMGAMWLRGVRGPRLLDALERLPLAQCFEIHMSGVHIGDDGSFRDAHHGVLVDEQLDVLDRLLALCPNLRVVTYEDPRFDDDGALIAPARANFARLQSTVAAWASRAAAP